MKFSHNKKRNTAFVYEVLITELSKAAMHDNSEKRGEIVKILKEFFSKGRPLKKDLEIYRSFENMHDVDEKDVEKMLSEAKRQYLKLSRELIFKTQTRLINEINKNFENIFSQLSTKGTTAKLVLENPETPLEEGVQIMVKIAQNKYLDIKSLSGGEKTMTALSFIFSIQEHDPASFYLLDEVDAALDKKNSEKLAELVRKYSTKAQYIVISHNDSVISGSDKLYGVSMHKDGISHVVSLEVWNL